MIGLRSITDNAIPIYKIPIIIIANPVENNIPFLGVLNSGAKLAIASHPKNDQKLIVMHLKLGLFHA